MLFSSPLSSEFSSPLFSFSFSSSQVVSCSTSSFGFDSISSLVSGASSVLIINHFSINPSTISFHKDNAFGLQGTGTNETSSNSALVIILWFSGSLSFGINPTETVFKNPPSYNLRTSCARSVVANTHSTTNLSFSTKTFVAFQIMFSTL